MILIEMNNTLDLSSFNLKATLNVGLTVEAVRLHTHPAHQNPHFNNLIQGKFKEERFAY